MAKKNKTTVCLNRDSIDFCKRIDGNDVILAWYSRITGTIYFFRNVIDFYGISSDEISSILDSIILFDVDVKIEYRASKIGGLNYGSNNI